MSVNDKHKTVDVDKIRCLVTTKTIKEYFDGTNIFITGATGFLGKVLTEKLLRSCSGINKIYILIRPKRGVECEVRFQEYVNNEIFNKVREANQESLKKLAYVIGDILEPQLGLSETDVKMLQDNVNIVFHSAATIKFNEPLKFAADMNVFGTKKVMDLCLAMKNLKSVVHVSTAYSNPYLDYVKEQVYGSKLSEDHQMFIKAINESPDIVKSSPAEDFVEVLANRFQQRHPNTYTLTKHYGEHFVKEYYGKLPICIVRPSIVTPALLEPYPGWIDNWAGLPGVIMEISRGTISSLIGNEDMRIDLIPVDVVCNTMITAAWSNGVTSATTIPIYNCTSGLIKPIKLSTLGETVLKYARSFPTKYVMLYPQFSYTPNRFKHWLKEIWFHFVPSLIFDLLMKVQGKKAFMFRLSKRYRVAIESLAYFASQQWSFETKNFQQLSQISRDTQSDAYEFNFDMTKFDWESYIKTYVLGIRTFILKDDLSSLPEAREKFQKIVWAKRGLQFVLFTFCAFFVHKFYKLIWT